MEKGGRKDAYWLQAKSKNNDGKRKMTEVKQLHCIKGLIMSNRSAKDVGCRVSIWTLLPVVG